MYVEKNFTSFLDREENESFSFVEVQPTRSLKATILRLKLRYFGHVLRAKRSLQRDIKLGQVAGHRMQEKPRMWWLDSIKEATGLRLEDLKEAVQDRKKWRTLVEEKTPNRVRTNVKWIQEKAMTNHSFTTKLA
jgi:hypothetical protein